MEIKLYCPLNLDLEMLIKAHPFEKNKALKKDGLLYIVHSIMVQRANKDDEHLEKIGKTNGFVPLHSSILKAKVPQYKNHINYLLDNDIIDCDKSYETEKVSKGYRLTDNYRGKMFKKVNVTDYTLCKKIKKDTHINKNIKKLSHLIRWFNTGLLNINSNGAKKWVESYKKSKVEVINKHSYNTKAKKSEMLKRLKETCIGFLILIDRIVQKNYYHIQDSTGLRLHTNLTNLPKGLRQFVKYDNKKLVSLDIKNSQPFMSLLLLKKTFWQSKVNKLKPTLKLIDSIKYNNIKDKRKELFNIIMCIDSSETLTQINFQNQEFIKNVKDGSLYEYLIPIFEKAKALKSGLKDEVKRKSVKKMVLMILFDDSHKSYNGMEDSPMQVFDRTFQSISKLFNLIKKDNYRNLSTILQRIESYLVLDRICGSIAKENPDIPLFTLHDSVITTLGNEAYVQHIMEKEILNAVDYLPKFSIEHWNQDCKIKKLTTKAA